MNLQDEMVNLDMWDHLNFPKFTQSKKRFTSWFLMVYFPQVISSVNDLRLKTKRISFVINVLKQQTTFYLILYFNICMNSFLFNDLQHRQSKGIPGSDMKLEIV